ncbi:hypothetical protein CPC16_003803 [Podila verticillata]|nr:hypothetical protein CPC16_003803 [Podila verticillata]
MAKTFHGRIEDTLDALVLFEACRQGVLPKLNRRLVAAEKGETREELYDPEAPTLSITPLTITSSSSSRSSKHQILAPKAPSPPSPQSHFQSQNLITPGSVFVFDETEAKICRWTDGRIWSPSRICGNFLVYHELYRKLPSQKYSARDKAGVRDGYGLKDKALRRKVEQDGLVVLGSRKGTFVLKKDGLIKKTICVKGISLPPPEKMKGGPLVVEMTTTSPSKMGRGRAAKAVESRVSGLNFTGTQHLVCYEQAGAMAGLYRPRDYVELREISLSKTFITSQKFRDPVQVRPLPAGQKPVEPSDEYIRQTRIVEVRTSPKATLPSTEPNVARSAPITTRKESGSATRRGGKRGIESKLRTVLNHPYTTRSQDRQLREVLEENQFLESSDTESKSASPLLPDIDQTNEDHADRITETIKRDPNDPDNSPLRLEPLAQEQVCESNRREYDGTMEAPSGQTSRNTKRHGQVRAQDRDTSERTLNREQDYERTFRSSDNDATECSSSNSSPVTITNGTSLSSSLTLSPATVPRDGPGALYSDPLSPTGFTSNSENMDMDMDMDEAAQTLQGTLASAYCPPRQYSIPNGAYQCHGHYGDAPEDSIRALLFEPDPMTSSYRHPPNDTQRRHPSNHAYSPTGGLLAYPEDHFYPPGVPGGEFRRWNPPYPPPGSYYGNRQYAIPGEYPAPFIPNYVLPPWDENYGASEDYPSSDVVSSDSFERIPVRHEYQSCSTEGYGPRPNEYQMTPQQVLHCQLQYRLRLHQMEEQRWIESHKRRRYVTSDEGSVGYHHPNAISSPPVGGASETKSKGTVSGDEEDEGVRSSWTTGVDFDSEASKLKGEQRSFGDAQLLQEQMPDSGPADSAHVIEWVDSDDGKETTVRHAISPIDGADMASESGSHQPSSRAQVWTPSNVSKVSDYSEQEQPIGRAHQWSSSPFGPKSACKRRRRSSSGEYLASADYEGFESPTVDNVAKDCRETSLNYTPTRYDSSQPIQIMSHVHINHRRRPSITNESTKPAEDITVTNLGTNEYLLYSHHQPATFEVVLEDTVVSHDEPPSAHLISEEDPFFSDLRARGIGGRSCLAVHASSSPAEPSSADDHGRDEPRDRSVQL